MLAFGNEKPMDTAYRLNLNILPPQTRQAFDFLANCAWLDNSGWYLAGGTALALIANHRKSYDLDFFSPRIS
jgi:hypothetical protein